MNYIKKDLNDFFDNDGIVTYIEPGNLKCEVKWAIGSIIMNKAGGGDEIPSELFQILKVLHSVCQASLSITNSRSLLKLMSIESVMPSNHLILCCPLLLLPSILSSIRVFSSESVLRIRWPKDWSFSFSISPSNELIGWISLQSKGPSRVLSNTTVQKHQFFSTQLSIWSTSHIHT